MRRLLLCVVFALLTAAALPFAAGANHSDGTGPKFQKVNGTGESPQYGRVHVNADNNGQGQDFGHFFIGPANGSVEVQGDVTCLRAEAPNRTIVGGRQRQTNMPFIIEITDNGEPGQDSDRHRWRPASPTEVGPGCPTNSNFQSPAAPIVRGNYIVHNG